MFFALGIVLNVLFVLGLVLLNVLGLLNVLVVLVFQFNSFMVMIREMLSRMEAEHKTKLEQLHAMQEQQR